MIVGIALMIYNYVRFDSIFEFGASYQLTVTDMRLLENRLFTIPMGLLDYFFSLPHTSSTFPYLLVNGSTITFYGYYYNGNMGAGLFILFPMMFSLLFIPKLKNHIPSNLFKFILTLVILGFAMALFEIVMGASCQRYTIDYLWMFIFASISIIFSIYLVINNDLFRKYFTKFLLIITFITCIINFLICAVQSEDNLLLNGYPKDYYSLKYSISFWE